MTDHVFVIGSNSFSGTTFCKHLLEQGYQVTGVSRSPQPDNALLPHSWVDTRQFAFHQMDINHHLDDLAGLLNSASPAWVVNFAAQSMVGESWDKPQDWFQTNTVSFSRLLNVLRGLDSLERYVHVTTPEVYGSTQGFIDETQAFNPSTPYAISRAAGDFLVNAFHASYDFPVISTRAANVYGEGQPLYRIIPKTIMSILLGHKLPLHGGGHSRRSFIHMDDVAEATLRLLQQSAVGECYHISTRRIVEIRELVKLICDMMDVEFEQSVEISGDRLGKDDAYLLNADKLRSVTGWEDKVSLENGLQRTIDWVKTHFDTLKKLPMHYTHKA